MNIKGKHIFVIFLCLGQYYASDDNLINTRIGALDFRIYPTKNYLKTKTDFSYVSVYTLLEEVEDLYLT